MAVQYHYGKFPPSNLRWDELVELLEPATSALARYDGILSGIPNAGLLFAPLTTQEAVLSSKIEGTQATMGEVLKFEAGADYDDFSDSQRNDIAEILNYRKAIRFVMDDMRVKPLCQRTVREAHRILMASVRGQSRDPGEYRRVSNWIGVAGCDMEHASYIPISADKLVDGMSVWENYLHADIRSKLVQIAILHAEFESLHPFLDGNGRLGRMLIPLFLTHVGLIQTPMFYISGYFETHKEEYYQRLRNVSAENDWTSWCKFFLRAVCAQAEESKKKALQIIDLYQAKKAIIPKLTHSQHGIIALDMIFDRPIFRATDFISSGKIPEATARRLLNTFRKKGLLATIQNASGRKAAMFAFHELINIAEGREVFTRPDTKTKEIAMQGCKTK